VAAGNLCRAIVFMAALVLTPISIFETGKDL
jgi:hypothetical protein